MLDDPRGTIRRIKTPSRRRRDGLIQYAYDKTSQSGEDGIINFLFSKLPITNDIEGGHNKARWAVDVGAWDGRHLSNTYSLFFMDDKTSDSNGISRSTCDRNKSLKESWKGIFIEADESKYKELKLLHDPLGNICHNVAISCQAWSQQSLANVLLQTKSLPNDFDFLCIDVDGTDYWLLHNIFSETSFRPKVICIEFNPTIPHSVLFIPPRDDTKRYGCSITALNELASKNDYHIVETTCYNIFFVHDLYIQHIKQEIPFEPCIDNLHEITMGTELYQLYDGTIKLSGCQKMLWHRKPIREADVQILSEEDRNFPFAPSSSTRSMPNNETEKLLEQHSLMEQMKLKHEEDMFHGMAIDMSPYCCTSSNKFSIDEESNRNKCSSAIFEQLEKDGFALVRGTGIPSDTCQKALKWTHSFLQDAHEQVRRSCLTKDRARRGYSPQNSENFASLIGQRGSNDLVRKFRIGPHKDLHNYSSDHLESATSYSLLQANSWPTFESWGENAAEFKASIEEYYEHVCNVANEVVCAICDGIVKRNENIKLPLSLVGTRNQRDQYKDNEQKDDMIHNTSILTLLGYRKGARHQGKHTNPLIASHSDVGVVTILLFDGGDSSVLQRAQSKSADSTSWVDVKLPTTVSQDPIFVVNIGDCLSDMSGGILPSTLHRVMPRKGGTSPRNCLALFMGLKPDEIITLSNNESITYEEWRRNRIARAQAVLRKHAI